MASSITKPITDVVVGAVKPLTVGTTVWGLATYTNPVTAAIGSGVIIASWALAEEAEQTEEAEVREEKANEEKDELSRDIIAAMIDGETSHLRKDSDWQEKAMTWFAIYYILRHLLFSTKLFTWIKGRFINAKSS